MHHGEMKILKAIVVSSISIGGIFTASCDNQPTEAIMRTQECTANDIKLKVTYPAAGSSGAPLKIMVQLSNLGSIPVNVSSIRNNKKLLIQMTNSKGERVEMSGFGNESAFSLGAHRLDTRRIVETLSPGDSWQWHINLSELFMLPSDACHLAVAAFINEDDMTKVFSVKVENLAIRVN